MAQRIITKWVSDLSGDEIDDSNPTVEFGLDGTSYEIDLTPDEAQAFRDAVAEYVGSAKRVTGGGKRRPQAKTSAPASNASDVREWARENGHEVPDRGRIPAAVREAYDAALVAVRA